MSENARSQDHTPPHGSMAEEAAKLVDVAHLWLVAQSAAAPGDDDVWAAGHRRGPRPCRVPRLPVLPGAPGPVRRQPGGLRAPGRRGGLDRRGPPSAGRGAAPRRRLMSLTIGVDVGGTKVAGGVVDEKGVILAQHRVETPARDAEATTTAITSVIQTMRAEHEIEAVGHRHRRLRRRGPVQGLLRAQPPGLAGRAAARGGREAGRPARRGRERRQRRGLGRGEFGAGRDDRYIVCVTVGTGIGGGIIVDRMLYRGGFGVGGEIGHIQMVEGGRPCGCGQRGCWEQYASGGALVREARERAAELRVRRRGPARPRRRHAGGHHRRARHPGRARGRPDRQGRLRHPRPLARAGAGRPGRRARPGSASSSAAASPRPARCCSTRPWRPSSTC